MRKKEIINKAILRTLSLLVLALGVMAGHVTAQVSKSPAVEAPPAESGLDTLIGRWSRPDGGYRITIRGVDAEGRLNAAYANPSTLPFAKAEASREGDTIKVALELRAGGYNGSTYDLTYDPAEDVLRGVYYQAVARQRFNVYFERVK